MCKIDACVDRFLHSLITSKPDYNPGCYSSFPDLDSFDRPALERITQELQGNLNRLVPEFLDGKPLDLKDQRVMDTFERRWEPVVTGLRSKDQDCVPKGLLNVLMEKQLQQRSGARQDSRSTEEQTAFVESCRQLKDLVDGQKSTASFACGGAIPISTADTSQPEGIQSSGPVNIFWAEGDDGTHARRLALPLIHESNPGALEALVHACSPATFGRGQQDVMDESYRKAGKLNPDQFATSFHPADFGIIETIERVLLPTMSNKQGWRSHRIHAELYKMNVCKSPSFGIILADDISRSTRGHRVSFVAMLILPALHSKLALWLFVSLLLSREAVWLYGTMARKLSLTGLQIPLRFSGQLSTLTASMRSGR